jgi:hypothetical protein
VMSLGREDNKHIEEERRQTDETLLIYKRTGEHRKIWQSRCFL